MCFYMPNSSDSANYGRMATQFTGINEPGPARSPKWMARSYQFLPVPLIIR